MKKLLLSFLFLFALIGNSQTTAEISETFLKKLIRNQYDSCIAYFDTSISREVDASKLEEIWNKIPQYVGELKSYENIRTIPEDSLESVMILCAFAKTKLELKFVYNQPKKIVGFFFIPPKSKTSYNLPEYYEASKQYETKLSVKTGTFEMPGLLCVPNNVTDPPVVILVAGSGANDRDETIGPNKPLRDLALGLAANGIASFRYDKRTFIYTNLKPEKTGLQEEVIEDVLSAIKILKAHAVTKNSKIIVAGHSLGAMCAPLIASKSKDVSAIIMLAGNARPLEDLIMEQFTYLGSIDTVGAAKELADLKKQVDRVKDPKKLKKALPDSLPLGINAYYWQSLKKYDQLKTATKVKQPILVLQGDRDYQVKMTDFNLWKKELEKDPKNRFISYPGLNHLFMKGKELSTPDEYSIQNNIDKRVIMDMTQFIKGLK